MIQFKDLKYLIQKNCKTEDVNSNSENYFAKKFNFYINTSKLEKTLSSRTDLHVIGFEPVMKSFVPSCKDIQLISEYLHHKEELEDIMNGSTQIMEFMIYCDQTGNPGESNSTDNFDKLNNPDKCSKSFVVNIINNYPVYRTLVVRRFNTKLDRFEYSIYFRSNYNMISYIQKLKDNGLFNLEESEIDVSATEESEE